MSIICQLNWKRRANASAVLHLHTFVVYVYLPVHGLCSCYFTCLHHNNSHTSAFTSHLVISFISSTTLTPVCSRIFWSIFAVGTIADRVTGWHGRIDTVYFWQQLLTSKTCKENTLKNSPHWAVRVLLLSGVFISRSKKE